MCYMQLQEWNAVILPSVFDIKDLRKGLQDLRKHTVGGRPALAKRTKDSGTKPIHAQTIRDIEVGAIDDPGILTIARLVDGMGLTLSKFFTLIEERQTETDSQLGTKSTTTVPAPNPTEAVHGASSSVSPTRLAEHFQDLSLYYGRAAQRLLDVSVDTEARLFLLSNRFHRTPLRIISGMCVPRELTQVRPAAELLTRLNVGRAGPFFNVRPHLDSDPRSLVVALPGTDSNPLALLILSNVISRFNS